MRGEVSRCLSETSKSGPGMSTFTFLWHVLVVKLPIKHGMWMYIHFQFSPSQSHTHEYLYKRAWCLVSIGMHSAEAQTQKVISLHCLQCDLYMWPTAGFSEGISSGRQPTVEKGDLLLYHKHTLTSCCLHATGCELDRHQVYLLTAAQPSLILHFRAILLLQLFYPPPPKPHRMVSEALGSGWRSQNTGLQPSLPQEHTEGAPLPCCPIGPPFLLPLISALGHAPLSVCLSLTHKQSRITLAPEPCRCRESLCLEAGPWAKGLSHLPHSWVGWGPMWTKSMWCSGYQRAQAQPWLRL